MKKDDFLVSVDQRADGKGVHLIVRDDEAVVGCEEAVVDVAVMERKVLALLLVLGCNHVEEPVVLRLEDEACLGLLVEFELAY